MYRQAKPVDWCQCCMRGVAFSNLEGSSDFLRDHNTTQVVNASDNAGCFHISFSFSVGNDLCVVPFRFAMWNGTQAVPYNNFTNYAVSICKRQEIIPQDLLFTFAVL